MKRKNIHEAPKKWRDLLDELANHRSILALPVPQSSMNLCVGSDAALAPKCTLRGQCHVMKRTCGPLELGMVCRKGLCLVPVYTMKRTWQTPSNQTLMA